MNIAVFASGKGSNFSAILKAIKKGFIKADLSILVCDNPKARVIEKAEKAKIKILLVEKNKSISQKKFEDSILQRLEEEKIDLIVLAGFMRLLSRDFVQVYRKRIINIHPSLLPSFKGAQGIKDAFSYGVKVTGVTVHFIDEEMDHGPIILQKAIKIEENDNLESLEEKIHKVEHTFYPLAIKLFVEDRLRIEDRKVKIIV